MAASCSSVFQTKGHYKTRLSLPPAHCFFKDHLDVYSEAFKAFMIEPVHLTFSVEVLFRHLNKWLNYQKHLASQQPPGVKIPNILH